MMRHILLESRAPYNQMFQLCLHQMDLFLSQGVTFEAQNHLQNTHKTWRRCRRQLKYWPALCHDGKFSPHKDLHML